MTGTPEYETRIRGMHESFPAESGMTACHPNSFTPRIRVPNIEFPPGARIRCLPDPKAVLEFSANLAALVIYLPLIRLRESPR